MRLTSKGQLTIPKALRKKFGLHSSTEVAVIDDGTTLRIIKKAAHGGPVDRVYGILKNPSSTDQWIAELRDGK